MRVIYDGDKHRSAWHLAYSLAFLVVVAVVLFRPIFGGGEIKTLQIVTAIVFGGFFLAMGWSALHAHLTLPIDVRVLDSGAIQVRPRSGEPVSLAATQIKHIRYLYEGSEGTLIVKADAHTWSLPASDREADEFIAALIALNPQIEVEGKKDWSPGG